jgi:hypothetical protein
MQMETRTDVLTHSVFSALLSLKDILKILSRSFKSRQGTNVALDQDLRISLQEHSSLRCLRHWDKGCRMVQVCNINQYYAMACSTHIDGIEAASEIEI